MAFNLRQVAAPGWPPRGEKLVGSPTVQLGLGAQHLVEEDLGRSFATTLADTTDPAAAPEPFHTGRVLDDSVERDVLANHNLSHLGLMLRRRSAANQRRVGKRVVTQQDYRSALLILPKRRLGGDQAQVVPPNGTCPDVATPRPELCNTT